MKKAQLTAVITVVLLVAAVAGFLIFAKYNVGRAPGDLIDRSGFEIRQPTPQPTPMPTLAPVGGGSQPQPTPQQQGGYGGSGTTGAQGGAAATPAPTPAPASSSSGTSLISSSTCKEALPPCEVSCKLLDKFKDKDPFAMSKEPSINVDFTCPGTKGILKLGYSLSAGSYRGFDSMLSGGDYKGAYDCARREGSFTVMVDVCALYDWVKGKK